MKRDPKPNRTIQDQIDQYTADCHTCDRWQLISWCVLIILLAWLNLAIAGAIIDYLIWR